MKIGFVLYDYYLFGGLQEDCLATALAVHARGHEVHIFTRTWKGQPPEGIQAHILGKKGWTNLSRNNHFFRALQQALPEHRLDGVVAFNRIPNADIYFAADPCYKERKRHLPWWRKLGARHRYYAKLEATVFNGSQSPDTLVLTERETAAFRRHYGVPEERFHLLPPGVTRIETSETTRLLNRDQIRGKWGTSSEATVALFVGSGFRIKGLDRALRALRANESSAEGIEFWVLGNGDPAAYQSLSNRTGIKVRFLGGRADVNRFYDAADFLLHPAYSESAGKVLLEALTHGLPVVTTDTCGYAPHIEQSGAGMIIASPFSQKALDQAVRKFILDAEMRQRMRNKALQYAASEDLYSCHTAAAQKIEELLERFSKVIA